MLSKDNYRNAADNLNGVIERQAEQVSAFEYFCSIALLVHHLQLVNTNLSIITLHLETVIKNQGG